MSKQKGDDRERQAITIYEAAGYEANRYYGTRFGDKDLFGHFDLIATRADGFRLSQVKSEKADGIADINAWAREHCPRGVQLDMLVVHDRAGWRLIRCYPDADTHVTVVDERERDCNMGDAVTEYLAAGGEGRAEA